MTERLEFDFDGLVTNISIRTNEAFGDADFTPVAPYVPTPGENLLEVIGGSNRKKSGYDVHAGCKVDVTETYGLYRNPDNEIFDRREVAAEWEDGDMLEINLDDGVLTSEDEDQDYDQARAAARRILNAVNAILP